MIRDELGLNALNVYPMSIVAMFEKTTHRTKDLWKTCSLT